LFGKNGKIFIIKEVKVPSVAKKTFDTLSRFPDYMEIAQTVLAKLKKITTAPKRAQFIHKLIDDYNLEVFAHPLVKEYSPCQKGCSACCHTQVSVTSDEAKLLAQRISEDICINKSLLKKQASAGNDAGSFYQLSYQERQCIFLDEKGGCKVYADRPSVCRTNAVLGEKEQCSTTDGKQQLRLVKTSKSDMVIYAAYLYSEQSGSLPMMVQKALEESKHSLGAEL
jgi:Fe-S-cluster containining protein